MHYMKTLLLATIALLSAGAGSEDGTGTGRTGLLWELVSRADSSKTVAVRPPSPVDVERFRELMRRGFLTRHPARWSLALEEEPTDGEVER
jgi:hypothetical protein